MDWYFQRKKVMTIHVLAELYMLTDKSPNFQATNEFIDRRIDDFREIEKFSSYVSL
jgi:ubiquinone biosynthesis protein COQ9